MDFLFGSEKQNSVNYLPSQMADIEKTGKFRSETMMPYYTDYLNQLQQGYNQALPGINKAAQGGSTYAGQMAQTLGETGESAARTGVAGLSSFFDPSYGAEQYQAAMAPIQSQYQQNVANQGAAFGGAGQLGSSRQALAGQQLAGANQAAQMQAAAGVMNNLNNQRLQAGQALGQMGGNYLQGGLGAQQARYGFATAPTDYLTKTLGAGGQYVNQSLYNAPYPGQQSSTEQSTPSLFSAIAPILPFIPGISDRRAKENIEHQGKIDGVDVYTFNYIWDKAPKFGVMAQDLQNTQYADAVSVHESGYYQVNYGMLPDAIRARAFA